MTTERTPNPQADAKSRILVVDDERPIRDLLSLFVEELGYEALQAANGEEALDRIREQVDVVLCDVNMPGMSGFELVRQVRADESISQVRIIQITGVSDQEARLEAVRAGADDFVGKPVDLTELKVRLEAQLQIKSQQDALQRHREELEEMVEARTQQLSQALDDMADAQRRTYNAYLGTIRRLALAAEYKDEITAHHIDRVSRYAELLARNCDLPPDRVEVIRHATTMHDVGKLGIPDHILRKPGKLTDEEFDVIKTHTTIGERILSGSASDLIETGRIIAISHHEKWDGRGYPNGLSGEDIPLVGRICAVADVFDALTTKRPYKDAFPNDQAYEILRRDSGSHFDPKLIDIFMDHLPEIEDIQQRYSSEDSD